jgi:glycosyltransferase involved in cell wall biosynthesis
METLHKQYSPKMYPIKNNRVGILHIIKSLGRGGAEILLPETLRKHDKQKYQFHYIYFLPWKNQVVSEIQQEGGTVLCLPANNNFEIMLKVRQIIAYVKKHNIQLIHCHLPWAGIVGRLAGNITGVPVVYTEHNKWERYHRITYFLNKLSFSNQQKVIAVSGEVANSIKKNYHRKKPEVQVVLNGIDTDKFSKCLPDEGDIRKELRIPDGAIVIGISCVFRIQKRLPLWLEIAHMLHEKHPQAYFIIVGDGVLRKEVHQKAETLGTEKYVHFAGMQTDTRYYLKAMDIFMMCSEFEGLPIALLEAMSMGCMPASTAAGGISELIEDGVNGVLVPVTDPMQLVNRLSEYLQHPKQIAIMKVAARETVIRSFSMQKMVNELEAIYDCYVKK